jgi:UDP-glucose 4-epimerase
VLSGTDRILITGGAGLIGSHIADLLVKQVNPEIIILDNFAQGRRENLRWALSHGRVEIVEGDIRDAGLVHDVMSGIDVVFHSAAIPMCQCAEDPRLAMEVLANGSFTILEAAVLNSVRKIIAASSAAVYGFADEFPTPEGHHPYNNRTLYGAAKTFNEGLLRSFHHLYGVDYVVLRYFNVYGPRMHGDETYAQLLIRWMDRIARRQPCIIQGNPAQILDFIYVDDIARANLLAANATVTDQVFNVGSGVEISLRDLSATLARVMGSSLPAEQVVGHKNSDDVQKSVGDISKAERLLGFRAETPLEEGLSRLVSWWERQRDLEAVII